MSSDKYESNTERMNKVYPDRIYRDNLAKVIRWVDYDTLNSMKDGDIYYLDVDHHYINPFYKKYGLDILKLGESSLFQALDNVHKGKKLAAFHFPNVKLKIKEEANVMLSDIDTNEENKPNTFNAVILAVGRRQAYPVTGKFKCDNCGDEEVKATDYTRKFKGLTCKVCIFNRQKGTM